MSTNTGAESYARQVYGGPNEQHAGSDGVIQMNHVGQNGGNVVPLVPGPPSTIVTGGNIRSKKGGNVAYVAVPAALLIANQMYGKKSARNPKGSEGTRRGRRRGSSRSKKNIRRRRRSNRRK
jgi:hypothetical protein